MRSMQSVKRIRNSELHGNPEWRRLHESCLHLYKDKSAPLNYFLFDDWLKENGHHEEAVHWEDQRNMMRYLKYCNTAEGSKEERTLEKGGNCSTMVSR